MTLYARVRVDVDSFTLDADMTIEPGRTVAVVGPNGAGKTTLLHALAGLRPLTDGRIVLDDRVLDDPAHGVYIPPELRPVGVVFQDNLLFPHLSALDNVAYGFRARGGRPGVARPRAAPGAPNGRP